MREEQSEEVNTNPVRHSDSVHGLGVEVSTTAAVETAYEKFQSHVRGRRAYGSNPIGNDDSNDVIDKDSGSNGNNNSNDDDVEEDEGSLESSPQMSSMALTLDEDDEDMSVDEDEDHSTDDEGLDGMKKEADRVEEEEEEEEEENGKNLNPMQEKEDDDDKLSFHDKDSSSEAEPALDNDEIQQQSHAEPRSQASDDEIDKQDNDTPRPITDDEFRKAIRELVNRIDVNALSIKAIVQALGKQLNQNLSHKKDFVKDYVMQLVQDTNGDDEDDEDDEDPSNDVGSDEDSSIGDTADDDDDASYEELRRSSRHASHNTKKLKKTNILAKRNEKYMKSRSRNQQVKNEELEAAARQLSIASAADRRQAEIIAAKFETDNDEMAIRRAEDRVSLLKKMLKLKEEVLSENANITTIKQLEQQSKEQSIVKDLSSNSSKNDMEEEDETESESDDELEVVGGPTFHSSRTSDVQQTLKANLHLSHTKNNVNPRLALKRQLQRHRLNTSNKWLAQELGYKDDAAHLNDCKAIEKQRRWRIQRDEKVKKQMIAGLIEKAERQLVEEEVAPEDEADAGEDSMGNEEEEQHKNTRIGNVDDEDEEATDVVSAISSIEPNALKTSKTSEKLSPEGTTVLSSSEDSRLDQTTLDNRDDEGSENTMINELQSSWKGGETLVLDSSQTQTPSESTIVNKTEEEQDEQPLPLENQVRKETSNHVQGSPQESKALVANTDAKILSANKGKDEVHNIEKQTSKEVSKKPKNAGWLAMLDDENRMRKRQQSKKSTLIDGEAEEEEEEDNIQGLEDFGFSLKKKSNSEDDEDDEEKESELRKDDMEHIVDELSDNEGDEEAGQEARILQNVKEEKARHKEMMRLMREGYDTRRHNGGSMRGKHRFDQLVAAGNRADAKRLGLLNDDELDSSDDEEEHDDGDANVEEDENALLDKILKDRFLPRHELDPHLTDDSDDEEELELVKGKYFPLY